MSFLYLHGKRALQGPPSSASHAPACASRCTAVPEQPAAGARPAREAPARVEAGPALGRRQGAGRVALPGRQAGFSLIEVLVAFSIMALVLTVLFQVFSTGLRTAGMAEQYSVAQRLAHSLLEETAAVRPLQPGERTGEFDGTRYRWQAQVEPEPDLGEGLQSERFASYRITVQVMWEGRGGQRDFSLSTLRLQEEG